MLLLIVPVISLSAPDVYARPNDTRSAKDVGKDITFDHITIEDGLSNNMVPGVVQDYTGFMWFGTFDGLNRYDGYEFKVYRHDSDDPASLSGNPIRVLYKDRAGNLWVGTWGSGLNMFVRETETFIRYRHDPDDPHSLSHDGIRSIFEDRIGTLWIGTNGGGLNRFDRKTGTFTHYRHDPGNTASIGHDAIWSIHEDRAGTLWVGTEGGGLNRFDRETGTFQRYRHDPANPRSLSHDKVRAIMEDQAGALWISTSGGGLCLFDRETESFRQYQHHPTDPKSLGEDNVSAILEDRTGRFWIATHGGGIDLFDRDTDTFVHHTSDPARPGSLNHNMIYSLYEDRSGLIWIGTESGGVNLFDPDKKQFRNYRNNPELSGSLSFNDVWGISEDPSGRLWICTNGGGLNRFDRITGTFTRYLHDPANTESLSGNMIYTILADRTGMVWIGDYGGGLDRFAPETGTFLHYRHNPADPQSLSDDMIFALYEDRAGILWVGTWNGGLNRFDRKARTFSHYRHNPEDPNTLSSNSIISIKEDLFGILWVGTMDNGLNRFDRNTGSFMRYRHNPDDPASLSNNTVSFVYEDRAGRFWVGTGGGGIDKFDRENERFIHFTQKDGLAGDSVYGIQEDRRGFLWLGTSHGLSRFNPDTETFRNYDVTDGIQGNQFNLNASCTSSSGEMFFGGTSGFTAFFPEQIRDNPHIPPVVVTKFLLSNKAVPIGRDSVLKQSIIETDHLTLSYDDQIFSFEFAALNYRSPEKNRYKYMLEGFDKEWSEVDGKRRFATYTHMDPGDYVFRVLASNNDGIWNEEGASIRITVTPPWWETVWFRASMMIFVIGLILGGFRWRVSSIERQKRRLETQVDEKTRELGELENAMKNIVTGVSPQQGSNFFDSMVLQLANTLDADYTLIGELRKGESRSIRTIALCANGEIIENIEYDLADTPCEHVINAAACTYPANVAQTFPRDILLQEMHVEGYAGTPLSDSNHRPIGVMAALYRQPIATPQFAESILCIFAAQTGVEIERTRTEEALRESERTAEAANQAKSTFLANMSHELRTPLNAIMGYAQILQRSERVDDDHLHRLRIIHSSGEHLLTLISDILDISKIEAGKMELRPTDIHIPSFLDGVAGIVRARAEEKSLKFKVETDALPQGVRVDEVRLRQILLNLLSNAVKFTDKGDVTLRIRTIGRREGKVRTIRFEVADTGVGISPDELDHVFEPFEQVGGIEGRADGTGLGLSITQHLVDMMGGMLKAESSPGQGSTFRFELSLPVVSAEAKEMQHAREITGYSGAPQKILAADDNPDNLMVLRDMLEPVGFEIIRAENGREAVAKALEIRPDLILMDLVMPVMNGFKAMQAIRRESALQNVPVIAVSASVLESDRRKSQVAGCDAFLPKPVDARALYALLETHINLTWTYAEPSHETIQEDAMREPLVPPPPDELAVLHKMALFGDMSRIEERAAHIISLGGQYRPFGEKLRGLAKGFEEKKIQSLVEQFMQNPLDKDQKDLIAEALAALPAQWITGLEQAILNIDLDQTADLIEQIRTREALLADRLKKYIDEFEYEELLKLIQPERRSRNE